MKGWCVDWRTDKYVASCKAGKGDLAVDVRGDKSRKRLDAIKKQAEGIMEARIEQLTYKLFSDGLSLSFSS